MKQQEGAHCRNADWGGAAGMCAPARVADEALCRIGGCLHARRAAYCRLVVSSFGYATSQYEDVRACKETATDQ